MTKWAALLQGVNVGGSRSLPMSELRSVLSAIGMIEPRTLLASGNAVFEAGVLAGRDIEALVEQALVDRLSFRTDVMARRGEDLASIIKNNPFSAVAHSRPDQLVVAFGREAAAPDLPDRLAAAYSGPERLVVVGREMYIDFPEGQGRSKLWPAVAKLGLLDGTGTARNWNTVLKLNGALNGV